MSNLIEQLTTARTALADAERRASEARLGLAGLAGRAELADEGEFAAARSRVADAQAAAEAARRRLEELEKLRGAAHRRLIDEAGALIREDWAALRAGRARRVRLHELDAAETAILEPSNSFGGPSLRRRIGTFLGNVISQSGVLGLDDTTFDRAEKEAEEFLKRLLS